MDRSSLTSRDLSKVSPPPPPEPNRLTPPPQSTQLKAALPPLPNSKPVIIGIYGIFGCGKTWLINELQSRLRTDRFNYYDLCEPFVISEENISPDTEELHLLGRDYQRAKKMEEIQEACKASGKTGIVTGHFLLWKPNQKWHEEPHVCWTTADEQTYTHMVYLKPLPSVVAARRARDRSRGRPAMSQERIDEWQEEERMWVNEACDNNRIVYKGFREADCVAEVVKFIQQCVCRVV